MSQPSLKPEESWGNPFGDTSSPILEDFDFSPAPDVHDIQPTPFDDPYRTVVVSPLGRTTTIPLGGQPWPPGLIFDLSLGLESTQTILDNYGVSEDVYAQYLATPAFRAELTNTIKLNREQGVCFSRKAAYMAEDCLPDMYSIAKDRTAPANTRVAVFRDLTRLGKLEPKEDKDGSTSGAPQVNIQINL